MKPSSIRYKKNIKTRVVDAIINGELLVEEAMEKYGVMSKRTIIRWLKKNQHKRIDE